MEDVKLSFGEVLPDQGIDNVSLSDQVMNNVSLSDQGMENKSLSDHGMDNRSLSDQGMENGSLSDQGMESRSDEELSSVSDHDMANESDEESLSLSDIEEMEGSVQKTNKKMDTAISSTWSKMCSCQRKNPMHYTVDEKTGVVHYGIDTKIIPSSDKILKCTFCKKVYKYQSTLKTHSKPPTMTREEIICGKQGYQFLVSDSLYRSTCNETKSKYGTITGEQEKSFYICEVCGESFECDVNYRSHITTHAKTADFGHHGMENRSLTDHSMGNESDKESLSVSNIEEMKRSVQVGNKKMDPAIGTDSWSNVCLCQGETPMHYTVDEETGVVHYGIDTKIIRSSDKILKCTFCGKAYKYQTTLKTHSDTPTTTREEIICGKQGYQLFVSDELYYRSTYNGGKGKYTTSITGKREKSFHMCEVCGKGFKRGGNYRLHIITHANTADFGCHICGKLFLTDNRLKRHIKTHTGNKQHKCSVCGKGFNLQAYLYYHMQIHTGVQPFTCDLCDKSFRLKQTLLVHRQGHLRGPHATTRRFSCDTCGRKFMSEGRLKLHKLCHLDVRPFSCDICSKSFIHKGSLKLHKQCHLDARPFSCDICGKSFKLQGPFHMHERSHENADGNRKAFSCDVCGKSFKLQGTLTVHKTCHEDERPFSCDICGKAFKLKGHLRQHLTSHY